jgi:KUP system potassium uptake protein
LEALSWQIAPPLKGSDVPDDVHPAEASRPTRSGVAVTGLAALGVVFGDIGTSPLYTLKTVLNVTGAHAPAQAAFGSLSLILWALIIIVSLKYVALAMRVDNDGEGGILALMSLLGVKQARRPLIVAAGLFGAALIYSDGSITPAISVLSAVEGLDIETPALHRYILPVGVAILLALFAAQRFGTARIGGAFGPVMLIWFTAIGLLGLAGVIRHPSVLLAIDPRVGLSFLFSSGLTGLLVLGGVFLCVTGAEALYADMGQFGKVPIRLAWSAVVLPALVLNYAGQTALVLDGAPTKDNIFYLLAPAPLLLPLVLLATVATVIASQSIITGAFSMTRQAIHLGSLPPMPITQTSAEDYERIYVGQVNWLLMLVTLGLAVGFRTSGALAAAYGVAVSLTMLMTTALMFVAIREIWRWSLWRAGAVAGALAVLDLTFVSANMLKVAAGGYVPLLLAAAVFGVMMVWRTGAAAMTARQQVGAMPIDEFLALLATRRITRVPGTAVFLTRSTRGAPPALLWHVRHTKALQQHVFMLNVAAQRAPYVAPPQQLSWEQIAPDMWSGAARFGFMQRPDIPALVAAAHAHGCAIDPDDLTYFIAHETAVAREDGRGVPRWLVSIFAFLQRNSAHLTDYFRLPAETVVENVLEVAI